MIFFVNVAFRNKKEKSNKKICFLYFCNDLFSSLFLMFTQYGLCFDFKESSCYN